MFNKELFRENHTVYSFEVFPPKTSSAIESITGVIDDLLNIAPDYISVTYGAGGAVKDNKTVELCKIISDRSTIEPVAHMTCVGSTKRDIDMLLGQLKTNGVSNILSLRGDGAVDGMTGGDFKYASELVSYIHESSPNEFCVSGACYPAGHVESNSLEEDMDNLKRKVDSGVDYLTTQLFFDNNELYNFLERVERAKLNVPIVCGIMPLTSAKQVERMVTMSGATLPAKLAKLIARYSNNIVSMREAGLLYATEQIVDLLASSVDGIHLYTMNNVYVASKITNNIKGLLKQ